jgi:hypothetical protein
MNPSLLRFLAAGLFVELDKDFAPYSESRLRRKLP